MALPLSRAYGSKIEPSAQSDKLPHNGVNVKEARSSYKGPSLQNCVPHNGVNVKEARFSCKGPSLQNCLQCENYGIWLKGTLYELETEFFVNICEHIVQ